jgi:hypothetical protein
MNKYSFEVLSELFSWRTVRPTEPAARCLFAELPCPQLSLLLGKSHGTRSVRFFL